MNYERFEARARVLWEQIPEEYKDGVDGLVVEREALPHPTLADVYTLGECVTEEYPSDFGGPETIRSAVVLYHGSFRELARLDPAFGWEDELWETLTHELQHHLEWLAAEDALEGVDYAADQNFRRGQGESFDPLFHRSGEPVADGVWRVEREFFLERVYRSGDEPAREVAFEWHGRRHRVIRPQRIGDVCFIGVERGVEVGAGELTIVLVRRRGVLDTLRSLLRREPPDVVQTWAVARPAE